MKLAIVELRLSSLMPTKRWRPHLKQVVLIAYCDGSGRTKNLADRYLALSGVIASPDAWQEFERLWISATDGSPPWHSTDAFALAGDFASWERSDVLSLQARILNDCFNKSNHLGLVHVSCVVDLADWRTLKSQMPILAARTSPAKLCALWVIQRALGELKDDTATPSGSTGSIQFYFDRGEEFVGAIKKDWEAQHNEPKSLYSHVMLPESVGSYRNTIGLQAADYLRWHTWRSVVKRSGEKYSDPVAAGISLFAAESSPVILRYDELVEILGGEPA